MPVSSCKAADVFAGLVPDERPLRRVSPDTKLGEPASAELMRPRSLPVTATSGFCALPKGKKRTSTQLVPDWRPLRRDGCRAPQPRAGSDFGSPAKQSRASVPERIDRLA